MAQENEKKIVGAFLLGGLMGAGLALLFAPQSGKRTRRDISRFAKNVAGEARDAIDDATEYVHDVADRFTDTVSELASSRKEITEEARKKLVRTLDNVQKVIEKQKDRFIR